MSLAILKSRALAGMDAPEVTVEVHIANGLPAFTIVGLPDTEVKEAKDRVRAANADEAAFVKGLTILPTQTLLDICAHLNTPSSTPILQPYQPKASPHMPHYPDFSEDKGQLKAKRALEIAAAGRHSVLMNGPPGTGKTMLASRFPGILPPMTEQEAIESAAVQSLNSRFSPERWKVRPFRSPHHTASGVALIGGGGNPRPGEISLAHHGVLFLDELPEFDRHVLEVLREPLESGHIVISRAARQAEFPAQFQLIAAMNPCPCGWQGHPSGKCHCTPDTIARYQRRLSGPLLDRIDIQIQISSLTQEELAQQSDGEPSKAIAQRVEKAYRIQIKRQGKPNNLLTAGEIDRLCRPDKTGETLLKAAMTRFMWSARAYHRVLRIARTIADLAESPQITPQHIAEAIQYRRALKEY